MKGGDNSANDWEETAAHRFDFGKFRHGRQEEIKDGVDLGGCRRGRRAAAGNRGENVRLGSTRARRNRPQSFNLHLTALTLRA